MTVLLELIGQLLGVARDQRMDRFNLRLCLFRAVANASLSRHGNSVLHADFRGHLTRFCGACNVF